MFKHSSFKQTLKCNKRKINLTFTVAEISHCPRGADWDKVNSCKTMPRFPVDSHLSTTIPPGSCVRQRDVSQVSPPLHNGRLENLFTSRGFVLSHTNTPETHPNRDIHSSFVWIVIQPDTHNPDSDGIAWPAAWFVSLDDGGDILEVEAEEGGVGENETVTLVASHRQVYQRILGYRARNLEQV